MPTNILDSHSRLIAVKNRLGLNIQNASSVTSDYIRMKQMIREIRERLKAGEADFKLKYYAQKNFDNIFISNIPTYLETIPLSRLEKIHEVILEKGIETYLVKKLKLKPIDNDPSFTN